MAKRLILTPIKPELKAFLSALDKLAIAYEKRQNQGKWYYEVPSFNAYLTLGGHGKSQFALQSQFWINHFKNIKHVLTIGAAGGLSDKVKIADLVIVSEIIEHDYTERFSKDAPLPKFPTSEFYPEILASFKPTDFAIHKLNLASGDEDIVDVKRAEQLHKKTGADCVAWESAGGVRSAQWSSLNYSEIRGITDRADSNTIEDFNKNLLIVIERAVQLLAHCLI